MATACHLSETDPAGRYLVETAPRFADYRAWLSSDYLLAALATDPATVQKRLGDGFYEQKLIREQVAQLTKSKGSESFEFSHPQQESELGRK